MSMCKVVVCLDRSHSILLNGHLAKDSRYVSLDEKYIEIDLCQLTSDEKATRVMRNVIVEEADEDWRTNMQSVMGWNWSSLEVSHSWKTTKQSLIDIDYSEAPTNSGQAYGKFMNIRAFRSNPSSSVVSDGIKV